MHKTLISILLLVSLEVNAKDFLAISLPDWKKEEVSTSHLRFTSAANKNITLHLQVDAYNKDEMWDPKTLAEDVKKMEKIRNQMSTLLGIDNYKIETFKQTHKNTMPVLELTGSYTRLKNQRIHFKEINFYQHEHFLQLKIISEDKQLSDQRMDQIIKEIDPEKVKI